MHGPPLPCSGHRPGLLDAGRALYLRHTPSLGRLNHRADPPRANSRGPAPAHHAGCPRPSPVSRTLRRNGHVARPSVVRPQAPPWRRLHPDSRPGDFSGENPEASAYPSTDSVVARFGTVSVPTYRQALAGLSWLSFSPPAVSAGRRVRSRPRSLASLRTSSPRRNGLNGVAAQRAAPRTPRGGLRSGPEHCSSPPPHRFRYDDSDAAQQGRIGTCPGRPGSTRGSVRGR
jgi:hypothetical protein